MPTLEQVLETYPEKVKVVFKNFPLRNHKFAFKSATAALAAEKQGKFWEFHDKLFENYNSLNDNKIKQIAEDLSLDTEAFEKERKNPEILSRVRQDLQDGGQAGVRGTPVVFINGKKLKSRNLEGFKAAIEKALDAQGQTDGKTEP